jgi:hypothetical protein
MHCARRSPRRHRNRHQQILLVGALAAGIAAVIALVVIHPARSTSPPAVSASDPQQASIEPELPRVPTDAAR